LCADSNICMLTKKQVKRLPDGVIGIFYWHKYFWSHYGPGVDSASNRKEYQENFLAINAADA
jgi:hypothetical protein